MINFMMYVYRGKLYNRQTSQTTNTKYITNGRFYCATIAYHVGLNAVLGWPRGITANV